MVLGSVSAGNHDFSVSGDYWSGYVEEVQVIRRLFHCVVDYPIISPHCNAVA